MDIQEIKEYREDGSLMYECTKRFLPKSEEHLFDKRVGSSGNTFIRINSAIKYKKDGTVQWKLLYNDMGEVVGNHKDLFKIF